MNNNLSPKIYYEDDNLFVVDKPAGMIVNKADTTKDVLTLQDWVKKNFQFSLHLRAGQATINSQFIVDGYDKNEEFGNRAGIVHRLDKETSGLIIIAKNVEAFVNLQNQFKTGIVKKVYLALLHGELKPEEGEIDAPIGRLPWNRKRFGVFPDGREARTKYSVLSYKKLNNETLTLVEAYPETGRTHQIRVHFQYLKHPIFSDELYAGRKQARDDRKILSRHFLHAAKISFKQPSSGSDLNLESSLPAELEELLSKTEA